MDRPLLGQATRARRPLTPEGAAEALALIDAALGIRRTQSIGKLVAGRLYLHRSAIPQAADADTIWRTFAGTNPPPWNLARVETRAITGSAPRGDQAVPASGLNSSTGTPSSQGAVSHRGPGTLALLSYPGFDTIAHPELVLAVRIDLDAGKVTVSDYRNHTNQPILHRKELLVAPSYPMRETFAVLTREEERLGLYDSTKTIGYRKQWQQRITGTGVRIEGHRLVSHQAGSG